jgi:hypothetical protein
MQFYADVSLQSCVKVFHVECNLGLMNTGSESIFWKTNRSRQCNEIYIYICLMKIKWEQKEPTEWDSRLWPENWDLCSAILIYNVWQIWYHHLIFRRILLEHWGWLRGKHWWRFGGTFLITWMYLLIKAHLF